jgi:hypothetical protein
MLYVKSKRPGIRLLGWALAAALSWDTASRPVSSQSLYNSSRGNAVTWKSTLHTWYKRRKQQTMGTQRSEMAARAEEDESDQKATWATRAIEVKTNATLRSRHGQAFDAHLPLAAGERAATPVKIAVPAAPTAPVACTHQLSRGPIA